MVLPIPNVQICDVCRLNNEDIVVMKAHFIQHNESFRYELRHAPGRWRPRVTEDKLTVLGRLPYIQATQIADTLNKALLRKKYLGTAAECPSP